MKTITEAAIKHLPTNNVITGQRHYNCYEKFWKMFPELNISVEKKNIVQGFVTSDNEFVDRYEAAKIAFAAGQIMYEVKKLISEDLY